mgnify:CR=1 FL=1
MTTTTKQDPPSQGLSPERVLDAVEQCGYRCDGRLLALNSYENRVYQVGIEDAKPVIAKFYRPNRWTDAAILEEHQFADDCVEQEIPLIAPLTFNQVTLHRFNGFRFSLYKRYGGHAPNLDNPEHLEWLGRFIGRLHAVGSRFPFQHRLTLTPATFGHAGLKFLLENNFIPDEIKHNYQLAAQQVLEIVDQQFAAHQHLPLIRLHGDLHVGNILWTDKGPHIVDLDDCMMGVAMQDIWMLLSGSENEMVLQLNTIIKGYSQFYDFDPISLNLIEALRSLRILNYSAWLARRWHDPTFPKNFSWFNEPRYWEEQLYTLREQIERMQTSQLVELYNH